MTLDERLRRLTETHVTLNRELQHLKLLARQDGEGVQALLRLAESRGRHIS